MTWNPEDSEPIAIEGVTIIRTTDRAMWCERGEPDALGEGFRFWVQLRHVTPGCQLSKPGDSGCLSIPTWLWKRIQNERVATKPPPDEFKTDEVYRQVIREHRNGGTIQVKDMLYKFRDLYIACREEVDEKDHEIVALLAKLPPESE